METRWKRSFEIAVPMDVVWQAFTDPEYRSRLTSGPPGAQEHRPQGEAVQKVLEIEPHKLIRWSQEGALPDRAEFTVTFESTDGGSRVTVTRSGFGEGELAEIFGRSNQLGWEHGFQDMVLALETGFISHRHWAGAGRSGMGMVYAETDSGIEVRRVADGSFASEAGLEPGDRIVRIGGAAIYARSEMWLLNALFDPGTRLEVEYVRGREARTGSGRLSPLALRQVGE